MSGQNATVARLMQQNAMLMQQLAEAKGLKLSGRDGDDIHIDILPPKKRKLKDMIADGPPAAPSRGEALPPPAGNTAESPPSRKKVMKKKKRKMKNMKKRANLQTESTTELVPLANGPAVSEKDKLTTNALNACSGVLDSVLARHKAKLEASKIKKAEKKKENEGKKEETDKKKEENDKQKGGKREGQGGC